MNIKFECSCGQLIEVNSEAGGQHFNCPSCGTNLIVPQISLGATTPPPLPSPPQYINPQKYVRKIPTYYPLRPACIIIGVIFLFLGVGAIELFFISLLSFFIAAMATPSWRCGSCKNVVHKSEKGCVHCSSNFSN